MHELDLVQVFVRSSDRRLNAIKYLSRETQFDVQHAMSSANKSARGSHKAADNCRLCCRQNVSLDVVDRDDAAFVVSEKIFSEEMVDVVWC